ncbi:Ppx/GppA family phosphatase [Corticibacter populi]|uniref:Ppx/GppA family phosphatase n=1 Tax=Corticibacter populi TaxID=1550736 RepID=A0A3M6QYF4_9BURK|nr:Ppx/GppA phosphatase family protein [Corticibacter populi]RMX08050.1 Ppx/GppA family phosphatase [Corticibacter populi]RZS35295.1 exopolyphosphatase/guanosine-5'-triphosphate,3'-diphosphate pyrophosphatase [Corticibacter populi]
MKDGERLAAVDLGSNSFRLEISIYNNGHLQRVDYIKETVRQGGGLDADGMLTEEAMERGWQCLARFGERLQGFKPQQVRALATQTLREARNRATFLQKAQQLLGHPIEVISGQEEARLIYQGVSYLLPLNEAEERLVIDIGGRSTEIIAGVGQTPREAISLAQGSVSWSQRFFADGKLTAKAFAKAEVAANAQIEEWLDRFAGHSREHVYGASGTMAAVAQVLHQLGGPEKTVTRKGLAQLRAMLIDMQYIDRIELPGLREDRRAVISGGVCILVSLMDMLGFAELKVSDGALRQGALLDLIQREADGSDAQRDIRQKSVDSLLNRFGYDRLQGDRLARTARSIWQAWKLPKATGQDLQILQWAAQLHEIGISIAYERYHHHGAYIIEHGDCPGFLPSERSRLAQLIVGHRGKLKKVAAQIDADPIFAWQLLCLRLALLLCNARREPELSALHWSAVKNQNLRLGIDGDWPERHPQSYYLLQEEIAAWEKLGFHLKLTPQ